MKRRLLVLVSMLGLMSGTVAVASGVANAYSPGKAMTVSASPSFVAPHAQVTAVAHRVKPGCKVKFTLGSSSATAKAGPGGVAQVHLTAPSTLGWATVTAVTVNCSPNEAAATQVFVGHPHVSVAPDVAQVRSYKVSAQGFPADQEITIFISLHGKTVAETRTKTDSHGLANASFTLSAKGSYLAVATPSGVATASSFRI